MTKLLSFSTFLRKINEKLDRETIYSKNYIPTYII